MVASGVAGLGQGVGHGDRVGRRGKHLQVVAGVPEDDGLLGGHPHALTEPAQGGALVPAGGHHVREHGLRDVKVDLVGQRVKGAHHLAGTLEVPHQEDVCLGDAGLRQRVGVLAGLCVGREGDGQVIPGALDQERSGALKDQQAGPGHVLKRPRDGPQRGGRQLHLQDLAAL